MPTQRQKVANPLRTAGFDSRQQPPAEAFQNQIPRQKRPFLDARLHSAKEDAVAALQLVPSAGLTNSLNESDPSCRKSEFLQRSA